MPRSRPPRRTTHAARTARADVRTAILDAARASLAEGAFRELTIDAIMEQAGLTRTAFYRYFDDLGALVGVLLAESTQPLMRAATALGDAAHDADEASFRARLVDLATVFHEHGVVLDAAIAAGHYDETLEHLAEEIREGFVTIIAKGLSARAAATGIEIPAPAETARALNAMNETYLLRSFAHGDRISPEEAAAGLWPVWRQVLFRP
jgi:AcrR family transcriptional regulator